MKNNPTSFMVAPLRMPLYRLNCCSRSSSVQKYFRNWCCAKQSTLALPDVCLPIEECKRSIAVEWPDLCSVLSFAN
ncbi:hypothetical protein BT93_J0869 [Corymbia citriodora subsp. variegata]|nr:hypothetical protein BT93_J0869 [Corymbia citriodora subsp. variegata]